MPQPKEYRSNADRQAAYRRRRKEAHAALQSAKGLPPLPAVATMPGWRRWRQVLEQFEQALSEAHEQMQRYYDDRSDDWIESEKADEFTEKMEAVEELIDQIADCRGRIE
jgi:enamine deaminase RidA (YjgF/YER057c/UK114 family)